MSAPELVKVSNTLHTISDPVIEVIDPFYHVLYDVTKPIFTWWPFNNDANLVDINDAAILR